MSAQHRDLDVPDIPIDRGIVARVGQDRRISELEHEVTTLRAALESRTTIAVATGLLAERYGCSSAQAWALLTRLSSHANVKVREVARVLVARADGLDDRADDEILSALARHLPAVRRDA